MEHKITIMKIANSYNSEGWEEREKEKRKGKKKRA